MLPQSGNILPWPRSNICVYVMPDDHDRTQLKNREDCISKLKDALYQASIIPKVRNMRVGLTDFEKQNRLREKKKRAETKASRRQKSNWDD